MSSNFILLHVTNDIFDKFVRGVKTHEYRPRTRYYMQRLEKVRDYIAYSTPPLLLRAVYGDFINRPKVTIELRKAYLPKETPGSWFISLVRGVSVRKFTELPESAQNDILAVYNKRTCPVTKLHDLLNGFWYDIELET